MWILAEVLLTSIIAPKLINDWLFQKIPLESLGIDLENLQGDGNANTIIDGILSVARAAIVAGGYDNVALPEGSFGFKYILTALTLNQDSKS